jgi:hypothetical protein
MKEVKDKFLPNKDFKIIQNIMLGDEFPWYYNVSINGGSEIRTEDGLDSYQLTHTFYGNNNVSSDFFRFLEPLLSKIDLVSILRLKANLGPRTEKINKSALHCDGDNSWGRREWSSDWYTSIFYINTNNGYTYFEDGSKVKSVENRIVTFPCYVRHGGASCTDNNIRVVLNMNYIK